MSAPALHPADLSVHLLLNLQHVPLDLVLRDFQLLLQRVQQWPTVTPSGWCLAETQRHSAAGTSVRSYRPARLLVRHSVKVQQCFLQLREVHRLVLLYEMEQDLL